MNNYVGNQKYRSLVHRLKVDYVAAPKAEKSTFSEFILDHIKSSKPSGRFLRYCLNTSEWVEISDKRAIAKARQALREGAPDIGGYANEYDCSKSDGPSGETVMSADIITGKEQATHNANDKFNKDTCMAHHGSTVVSMYFLVGCSRITYNIYHYFSK